MLSNHQTDRIIAASLFDAGFYDSVSYNQHIFHQQSAHKRKRNGSGQGCKQLFVHQLIGVIDSTIPTRTMNAANTINTSVCVRRGWLSRNLIICFVSASPIVKTGIVFCDVLFWFFEQAPDNHSYNDNSDNNIHQ